MFAQKCAVAVPLVLVLLKAPRLSAFGSFDKQRMPYQGGSVICDQSNKQKAMYAKFSHLPSLKNVPALHVIADVIWDDLEPLRAYGARGLFQAWTFGWGAGLPSGYCGPQATAKGQDTNEQVLFSLWDGGFGKNAHPDDWRPALPDHRNCQRNCNDCAVHSGRTAPDGSTGTQCKVRSPGPARCYYPSINMHRTTTCRANLCFFVLRCSSPLAPAKSYESEFVA